MGLSIEPLTPRVSTLLVPKPGVLVAGYERTAEGEAISQVLDLASLSRISEHKDQAPLSLVDGRGNICAVVNKGESFQLVIRQDAASGWKSGVRFARVPMPSSASAAFPYAGEPAHFAPDGTLILLGAGRDRLYRVNLALGEARSILPDQAVDIMDFDVTASNELVLLDGFEQRILWLNQLGETVATAPLSKNEGRDPTFFYLSLAAGDGYTAWVGLAVRQADGSFVPEVQRVATKLRQRLSLDRREGLISMPMRLAADGAGGVVVVDERSTLLTISSSVQAGRPVKVPAPEGQKEVPRPGARIYLTDAGRFLPDFDQAMLPVVPELNLCYEKLRQVSRKAKGTFRVQLATQDRGIDKVDVYQKDFEDFGLESCVGRALRTLKFNQRVGQQSFRLELKFLPPGRS